MHAPRVSAPKPASRFRALAAALILELCGGSIYIVSLYLKDLEALWFPSDPKSLEKAESLAFACNLGNWIPLAGIFFDSRFGGPFNTVVIGCLLTLFGYGGLWLCCLHVPSGGYESNAKLWALRVLWFCWGHGSGYFDGTSIATTAHNFSAQRGSALGVVKALYGLSGSLLAQPYNAFFDGPERAPAFLLFLALALPALGACALPFVGIVHIPPTLMNADQPQRRLRTAGIIILVIALILATVGVLRSTGVLAATAVLSYSTVGVVVVGVAALLSVARNSNISTGDCSLLPGGSGEAEDAPRSAEDSAPCAPAAEPHAIINDPPASARHEGDGHAAPEGSEVLDPYAPLPSLTDRPVWDNLRTSTFYLLFVAFFGGTGGGLVFTNHIAFIVLAAQHPEAKKTSDALISLFSIFNAFGRLIAGIGSDQLRRFVNRPTFFALAACVMGAGHALLLGARYTVLLYVSTLLIGSSYGALWALLPTLVSELFGLSAFASTYMAYTLATSSAALILSQQLASRVAEAHTPPPPPPPPGAPPPPPPTCYGDACYQLTHLVVIACCVVGALCVSVVSLRTRGFYRKRLRAVLLRR